MPLNMHPPSASRESSGALTELPVVGRVAPTCRQSCFSAFKLWLTEGSSLMHTFKVKWLDLGQIGKTCWKLWCSPHTVQWYSRWFSSDGYVRSLSHWSSYFHRHDSALSKVQHIHFLIWTELRSPLQEHLSKCTLHSLVLYLEVSCFICHIPTTVEYPFD